MEKLEEFLQDLLPEDFVRNFSDKYFDRDRKKPAVRGFGAFLLISVFHVDVWSWIQRLVKELEGEVFQRKRGKS